MTELDEEQKKKLRVLYGHLSRLYSSSISHFLGLIGAWLVLVYTSKTSTIEPLLVLLIAIVLLIMVGFSWFRILNFTRLLYDLETQLGLVELKENLKQFHIPKRPFSRKNIKILSTGEWAISLILLLFYALTLYWTFST